MRRDTKRSLLVLDDEPWNVSWIADIAAKSAWRCEFARSYDDAVKVTASLNPSLFVVDIRIGDAAPPPLGATLQGNDPTWVGLRFVRFIRVEKRFRGPVLVYTGVDREQLRKVVEDDYGARYFSKFDSTPFSMELSKIMK